MIPTTLLLSAHTERVAVNCSIGALTTPYLMPHLVATAGLISQHGMHFVSQ